MFHTLIFNVEGRSLSRNLGPYRIAHWLRSKDWDVEVIDYAMHWSLEELQELVESRVTKDTKFFGFSFLFGEWTDTIETFAIWLKVTYPNIPIISGSGALPTKQITVDYHVWGFGEFALDHLLMYLFSNGQEPIHKISHGVKYIDATLYPAYPLQDYSIIYEDRDFIQPWEFLGIETGRGCKFKCTFCNFTILGVKEDHSTSAESFERQLKDNWERWGVKNYLIAEETFNDRPDKIAKFAKVVSGLDFDPWFSAFIRLDLLLTRKDERQMLKDMNVLGQFYGVESFNLATAKAVRKGMAPEKIKEGLLSVKEFFNDGNKYRGTVSLIMGAPYESKESLYNSLDWLIANWGDQACKTAAMGIPQESDKLRQSELSTTYANYGYTTLDLDKLLARHPNISDNVLKMVKEKSKRNIVWENPQMDLVEAEEFDALFKQTGKKHNWKRSNFAIPEYSGFNSTLEEKLAYTVNDAMRFQDEEWQWYQLYKFKKLCWRK
jgi:hypothetical protein